ncbi:MAG: helix-turn-helix transcriptional regulator [Candidatus Bathyarchaeia archaeon]
MSGYDMIVAFQKRFNLFISPGTIYLTLYTLEREGLIRGEDRRKRVYILASKGEKFIEEALAFQENIKLILSKILRNNYPKLL